MALVKHASHIIIRMQRGGIVSVIAVQIVKS